MLESLLPVRKNSNTSFDPTSVAIIDYGLGNIASIVNACKRIGVNATIICNGDELCKFSPTHVIMPGVGAVGNVLDRLTRLGLKDALTEVVIDKNAAYLGICVGMQILVETCEEFGSHKGLGWIPGITRPINCLGNKVSPLPHVGWNTIHALKDHNPLLSFFDKKDAYFVHSNAVETKDEFIVSTTSYGCDFASSINRGRIYGVQFHPEKSAILGEKMLNAFVQI
jgi:glutamine amidotransferase